MGYSFHVAHFTQNTKFLTGPVISPLLANIYLHEILDTWFARDVKPRLHGEAFMVRYADDAVLVFANEVDARRVMDVLQKRFGKYDLTLHPEKTRLVDFRGPQRRKTRGHGFDLLGFTWFWARSEKRQDRFVIRRTTSKSSFTRALKKITQWCRTQRHHPVKDQHAALTQKLRGHYAYFGITGNGRALGRFVHEVERAWRCWLDRRSNKARMKWERFRRLLQRLPLPPPRIVHRI